MKVIFGCLLIAFLVIVHGNLYAQSTPSALQGKVLSADHSPAASATIVLLRSADTSVVKSAVTGKDGAFKFNRIDTGSYLLSISKIGYGMLYAGPYQVKPNENFTTNDIIITQVVKQLSDVSITSSRPDVDVKPGRIIINVQSSLQYTGSTAFDILRQAPGVRVDNNNNISIIGRQNALVTIDGKSTNLSGEDLVSILRSMPSNTIDRIELITSGSAKNDASSGGTINIVSKKGTNTGVNATVTGTAGYGKYYKGTAGVVFNDRTTKFNVFGNYNYSTNKTFHDFNNDRAINFDDVASDYHVNYTNIEKIVNNTFGIGTDYYLSPTQTIGFFINGSIIGDSYTKNDHLAIENDGVLDSTITTKSNVRRHVSRVNYNLNYSGKLDKKGTTLTGNLNYYTYNRTSDEYISNYFYDPSGNDYRDPLLLQNLSPSDIHIWLSAVDFSHPVSKTSKFDAGLKYSKVTSNNDFIFGPKVDGVYTSDPNFSNHFVYTENVNAAYVNFDNKWGKFNLVAGLRAEQTIAKGNSLTSDHIVNSNYVDLFPSAVLTYAKDDKNAYSLSFTRGIRRPGYEDLNPFLYYVDVYDYRTGNPNLKPEYSNSAELSYTYDKTFVTTLYSSIITDAYTFNFYEQNDSTKINVNTNINLGRIYNYGIRFFAPVRLTSWWNANFGVDASYQRYVAYLQNGDLNKGTQDIIFTSEQNFVLGKTFTATVSGRYESPSFYGVNQFKSNYFVNAAIGKQLFDNRGSLRLNVTDVFNNLRDRTHTNYQNLDMTNMDKRESQVARLTFTYRFGKTSLKTIVHHPGNETEQNRAGAGNEN